MTNTQIHKTDTREEEEISFSITTIKKEKMPEKKESGPEIGTRETNTWQ